jgi:CheY-like chemotaxis protein
MKKKRVLLIEDEKDKRESLLKAFTDRGFETFAAGTILEARDLAKTYWESLDVMVADMLMEDDPEITGAHIGIEFRRLFNNSPECFILTNHPKVEYYKLAMELGASAFLDKISFDSLDIVRYARALALRKSLSIENPGTMRQILKLVAQSTDRFHAVKMFCQKIFAPELESCLGAPFLLILTTGDKSEYCAGDAKLPREANNIYNILNMVAQPEINKMEPKPLELKSLGIEVPISIPEEYKSLEEAVLLPIFSNSEYRISITLVIQQEKRVNPKSYPLNEEIIPPGKLIEDPIKLWKVLNQYLRPTVVEHLLTIFSEWNHIKTTLKEISQICVWIGQEQKAILKNSEVLDNVVVKKLRAMANDLTESGNLLRHIERPIDGTIKYDQVSVKKILDEVWEDIEQAEEIRDDFKPQLESDCEIEVQENDLYVVFSRLLQWFIKRSSLSMTERDQFIKVDCKTNEGESIITITDNSKRLSETIRKELFSPFTQSIAIPFKDLTPFRRNADENDSEHIAGQYLPLYIAKMIVEVKYGGELIDRSNDLEEALGNRFILRFTKEPKD